MRRVFFLLLRISISLVLIYLLFRFIDFSNIVKVLSQARINYIIGAFIFSLFIYILALFRWKMLLEATGIDIPFKRITQSYLLSLFFNLFFLSTIGGDFARSLDLSIHTKRTKDIIATVFLDRLSGYFGLMVICLLSLLIGHRLINFPSVYISIGILFILFLFLIFILFKRDFFKAESKIGQILNEIHSKIYYFRERPDILIKNLGLSLLIQLGGPVSCYILAIAFGKDLSLIYFLVIIPIVGAVSILPISIGGLGIRDLSLVYFLTRIDISLKDTAFAISLSTFFFIILIGLFGGIFYVLTFHFRRL